jgi:Apolipoprotein N-acyltransferase
MRSKRSANLSFESSSLKPRLQQNKPTELSLKIYHKQDLLPFAEYVPFSTIFHSLREWKLTFHGEKTYFQPGTDEGFVFAFLSKDGVVHRTGIRICYEVMYLSDTVNMIRNGAQMLALISNDELFAKTPESYRMMGYTRLIAITTRRSVARDANTGLSFC